MKAFVTGGSGLVGSTLIDLLLARGDEVLAIDNFATGRRDNLQPHAKLRLVEDSIVEAHRLPESSALGGNTQAVRSWCGLIEQQHRDPISDRIAGRTVSADQNRRAVPGFLAQRRVVVARASKNVEQIRLDRHDHALPSCCWWRGLR